MGQMTGHGASRDLSESHAGNQWGVPISDARKVELARSLIGVALTGADVFWLAARALAGAYGDIGEAEQRLRDATQVRTQRSVPDLSSLHLAGVNLGAANLDRAALSGADLERAFLGGARLQDASLVGAHLDGANLQNADLRGADLRKASFDKVSNLSGSHLNGAALDQVIFDNTNLAVVNWSDVRELGEETVARDWRKYEPKYGGDGRLAERAVRKKAQERVAEFRIAARAYRSLAIALRAQGLAGDATRYQYRAFVMDRKAFFHWMHSSVLSPLVPLLPFLFAIWLFFWLVGTFTRYGLYLKYLFLTYAVIVGSFAVAYFVLRHPILIWPSWAEALDALSLSATAFHGRGLQPPGLMLTDTMTWLAGLESILGLLLEGLFIAAFTRRVTGN